MLIVEDNKTVRELIVEVLHNLDYKVIMAESTDHCIKISETYKGVIDLLITDVIKPSMNGKELYNRLKQKRPDLKVLFISGYTDNVIGHHGIPDNNVAFLEKPFTISGLSQKVREVIKMQ